MAISVKLDVFEGPLDLLLHLIDKNKIDIYDIPIVLITKQYLDYIETLDENMDIVSEFLVMAATLLDIKCKMLLPKQEDDEGEEIDPRSELVKQLLEYKLFKHMSISLRERLNEHLNVTFRSQYLPDDIKSYKQPINYDTLVGNNNISSLKLIFDDIMKRQIDKIDPIRSTYGTIEKESIDLDKKVSYIEDYIKSHKKFSFRTLLENQNSKMEIVISFLVILELMKTGHVVIEQVEMFGDIMITATGGE